LGSSSVRGGVLENFTSLMIRNDITMPSEASFELGDDGTWNSLGDIFEPGVGFQVYVDEQPRMRGRVEMNDVPLDISAGAVVRFTVRTKLSDAMYASANQGTKVKGASVEDFVLAVYAPLGLTAANFEFLQGTSLNLMTGKNLVTGATPVNLARIKVEEARVKPPETISAAVDRHLRRHGLMHWDDPTGKIVIGAPGDEEDPIYTFNMFRRDRTQTNNTLGSTRTRDWSGVPSSVNVYGRGGKRGFTRNNVGATANDDDVTAAGLYRPLHILAEGIRTNELAVRAANRELAARSKRKDGFTISTDGFAQWNGEDEILYAPDAVAQVNTDVAGGDAGPYYVHATTLTRDAEGGDTCALDMVKRGIWRL
jgi:prophage tail gpP-like protein